MKKVLLAAAMVVAMAGAAFAGGFANVNSTHGQTKATLNVTAQVINACEVTTTPVNFGIVDATSAPVDDLNAVGSVNVSCTSGQVYAVELDKGQNSIYSPGLGGNSLGNGAYADPNATSVYRAVANGMNRIPYELFLPDTTGSNAGLPNTGAIWGDANDTLTGAANSYPAGEPLGADGSVTGSGFTQSWPVYGTLYLSAYQANDPTQPNMGIPAGIYTDVVNVTVDF